MMSARYSATLAGEYEMLKKAAEDITRCGWDEARQLAESLDFGSFPLSEITTTNPDRKGCSL